MHLLVCLFSSALLTSSRPGTQGLEPTHARSAIPSTSAASPAHASPVLDAMHRSRETSRHALLRHMDTAVRGMVKRIEAEHRLLDRDSDGALAALVASRFTQMCKTIGVFRRERVYVYDLPPIFNTDLAEVWQPLAPWWRHCGVRADGCVHTRCMFRLCKSFSAHTCTVLSELAMLIVVTNYGGR